MTAIIASLLPIALYLLALKVFDSFALARWGRLGLCFLYGACCCLLAFLVTRTGRIDTEVKGFSVMPVVEELLKAGIMIHLILRKKIKFLAEALIYGAAVGGGFSMVENIVYLGYNSDMSLGTALFRGFGCAILHIGCTALAAALLLITSDWKYKLPAVALSLLPSMCIHVIHNLSLVKPEIQLAAVILLFLAIFLTVFNIGEKKIYRWMDHSISTDVQTLSAIKLGNFSATKAGQYLLSVKEQFNPEVFFDMICYVQLYLEAKIEKQSYMLLCQAGFDGKDNGFDVKGHEAKISELDGLKKNIGKTGYIVLSPIVKDPASSLSLSN